MKTFELIATGIETPESDSVQVYERHGFDENGDFYLEYMTVDDASNEKTYYISEVNPEKLTDGQRFEVLNYCLGEGNYHKGEIVNYLDLFLHGKYLRKISKP